MNTSYIYSATKAATLSNDLLSHTDIERLLVAKPGEDLQSALKETYLAPFLLEVPNEDMYEAIEATLVKAKKLIHRTAPDGDVFRVLWVQYDIHNLRVFAKATRENLPFEELSSYTSLRGIYTPAELYEHAAAGTLNRLQIDWQSAYDAALRHVEAGELDQVDAVFDALFFAAITRIATSCTDAFIKRYVTALIDMHNLKTAWRRHQLGAAFVQTAFVSGGTFAEAELSTKELVKQAFEILSPGFFTAAVTAYEDTRNSSMLDARLADYITTLAKTASVDMFSSASVVLYYQRAREAAANIRTIVVGRNSGMDVETIRANLRTAYVNN